MRKIRGGVGGSVRALFLVFFFRPPLFLVDAIGGVVAAVGGVWRRGGVFSNESFKFVWGKSLLGPPSGDLLAAGAWLRVLLFSDCGESKRVPRD